MTKYDLGGALDTGRVEVTSSVNIPQFPELSLESAYHLIMEHKRGSPWGVKTGGSINSRSLLYNGVLYFGANDHNFYAVDAKTGMGLWRFGTGGPVSVWSLPLIWKEGVVFSSYDHNLYCISLDGKKVFWKFMVEDKIATTPAVHNDIAYFGSKDKNFYAISLESGKEIWRLPVNQEIVCSPVIYKSAIYFGSRDGVYKISLDGRIVWRHPITGDVSGKICVYDDRLFFGCTDRNVYALSIQGKLLWKFPTGGPIFENAVVYGGRIYIGSLDGNVYCLNLKGNVVWKFHAGEYMTSGPEIMKGRIYFSSSENVLYCTTTDGNLVWKRSIGYITYLTISDGVIFASDWECKMHALTAEGKKLWEFHTSLSYQSEIEFEQMAEVSLEVVHASDVPGDKQEGQEEKAELGDYGDFEGTYIGKDMRDYIGTPVEKGLPGMAYKSRKGVYRK